MWGIWHFDLVINWLQISGCAAEFMAKLDDTSGFKLQWVAGLWHRHCNCQSSAKGTSWTLSRAFLDRYLPCLWRQCGHFWYYILAVENTAQHIENMGESKMMSNLEAYFFMKSWKNTSRICSEFFFNVKRSYVFCLKLSKHLIDFDNYVQIQYK